MGVLLEKLTETIEGTYRARGDYSETQYDAVTLVVRLGGPKLLPPSVCRHSVTCGFTDIAWCSCGKSGPR